jgi:hypothetical protein
MSSADSWLRAGASRGEEVTANRRNLIHDVLTAQRIALPWAMLALLLTGTLLGTGIYVLHVADQPLSVLVRDANAIARQPNYSARWSMPGSS